MAIATLEARVERLEIKLREVEARLPEPDANSVPKNEDGSGLSASYENSPDFDEVERIGPEWRNSYDNASH